MQIHLAVIVLAAAVSVDDVILCAEEGFDFFAAMDAVDHLPEIDTVRRAGIFRPHTDVRLGGIVADDAMLRIVDAVAAMQLEVDVTGDTMETTSRLGWTGELSTAK